MVGILSAPTVKNRRSGILGSGVPQPAFTPVLPGEVGRLAQQQAYAGYGTQQQNRNFLQGLYGQNNSYQSQKPNQQGAGQEPQEPQGRWRHSGLPFPEGVYSDWEAKIADHSINQAKMTPEQMMRAGWRFQPGQVLFSGGE
jgi:hypothetical protein